MNLRPRAVREAQIAVAMFATIIGKRCQPRTSFGDPNVLIRSITLVANVFAIIVIIFLIATKSHVAILFATSQGISIVCESRFNSMT